jgi:hypothetical protein
LGVKEFSMANPSSVSSHFTLSALQWLLVLGAFGVVPLGGYLLLRFVRGFADIADSATWVAGGVSLAVSAYAALSANKLKALEIERGDRAAQSLVASDAQEALTQAEGLRVRATRTEGLEKDEWQELLSEIHTLAQRAERKFDQLGILSAYFMPARFIKVRELYLRIRSLWALPEGLSLEYASAKDVQSLLPARRCKLAMSLTENSRSVLSVYEELELPQLPSQITEFASSKEAPVLAPNSPHAP